MNTEIKAGVDTVTSIVQFIIHLVEKKGTATAVDDLAEIASRLRVVVQGWGNIGTEVKALTTVEAESDLLVYLEQKAAEIVPESRVSSIVLSALKLAGSMAINSYGLVQSVTHDSTASSK